MGLAAATAAHMAWCRSQGRAYQVRDASAVEAATWQETGSPAAMFARTIVRACDGAAVTLWCHAPDMLADHCDDELKATFEDARAHSPIRD